MADNAQDDHILVPTAPGGLKEERIADPAKVANVRIEKAALMATADAQVAPSAALDDLWEELYQINSDLWVIEDDIRDCEMAKDFGEDFIRLARAVYITNDRRAAVKKKINLLLGSSLVEEKSYADHGVQT